MRPIFYHDVYSITHCKVEQIYLPNRSKLPPIDQNYPKQVQFPPGRFVQVARYQSGIVHRSGKEYKIMYKINKGEKGLIDR